MPTNPEKKGADKVSKAAEQLSLAAQKYDPEKASLTAMLRRNLDSLETIGEVLADQEKNIEEMQKKIGSKGEVSVSEDAPHITVEEGSLAEATIATIRAQERQLLEKYGINDKKSIGLVFDLLDERRRVNEANFDVMSVLKVLAETSRKESLQDLEENPEKIIPIIKLIRSFSKLSLEKNQPEMTREIMGEYSDMFKEYAKDILGLVEKLVTEFTNKYAARIPSKGTTGLKKLLGKENAKESRVGFIGDYFRMGTPESNRRIEELAELMKEVMRLNMDFPVETAAGKESFVIKDNENFIIKALDAIDRETGKAKEAKKANSR